jgi:hypothetical protein
MRKVRKFTIWKRIIVSSLVAVLLVGKAEAAGPLRDTIKNLFGPDGIILEPGRALPGSRSRAGDFQASSLQGLDQLNNQITSTFGVFPFSSSVTGFSFDLERGIPIRTSESLGPLLTERAPTLGAKRLDVNFTYTRIAFTQFQGTDLENVPLVFAAEDINNNGLIDTRGPFRAESDQVRVRLNLDIKEDLFAIIATYGLTSSWDIGVVVPVVHLRFRADGQAVIVDKNGNLGGAFASGRPVHLFRNGSSSIIASGGGDATGVGDVIIRTKYNLFTSHSALPDLSAVVEVKLPTGSRDDLLGTGGTDLTGLLVASKTYGRWFTPHLNLGYVRDTRDTRQSKIRYAGGFDARLLERLTLVADVIGFSKPNGNGVGNNIVDLSLGAKWNPIGSWFLGANFQIPLNKGSGLRADVIPTFAVEYLF